MDSFVYKQLFTVPVVVALGTMIYALRRIYSQPSTNSKSPGNVREDEDSSSASDDGWLNDHVDGEGGGFAGGTGVGGVEGTEGVVKERRSWYRSQFKELENLGKGGFGTVVKVGYTNNLPLERCHVLRTKSIWWNFPIACKTLVCERKNSARYSSRQNSAASW